MSETKAHYDRVEAFDAMVLAWLDGVLESDGIHQLRSALRDRRYLRRFAEICRQDQFVYESLSMDIGQHDIHACKCDIDLSGPTSSLLWQELADFERQAPTVEVSHEHPARERIAKVVYPVIEKQKVSRLNLAMLTFSAAALLMIVVLLHFADQSRLSGAILTDSVNGLWANTAKSIEAGTELSLEDGPCWLQGGFIKLLFGNDAEVVIESPARFEIISGSEMKLLSGKAYARVSKRAVGFTVYTPSSTIVDLGTEFGVGVDSGCSEIHVIKGKTSLSSRAERRSGPPVELAAGLARQIDPNGISSDIRCDDELFVSEISSQIGVIYRGQKAISIGQWQQKLGISLPADLLSDGRLVQAVNVGINSEPVTINRILFSPLTRQKDLEEGIHTELKENPFYSGSDENIRGLLEKSRRLTGKQGTRILLTLPPLTIGQTYRLQLIVGFPDAWTDLNCYGINREYMYFPDEQGEQLGLAVYTWTAQSPGGTITLTSPDHQSNHVHLFGYVIHELNQTEPDFSEGANG